MALFAARAEPASREQVATLLGPKGQAPQIAQRALQADGPWILSPDALRVARHLRGAFPTIGDRWRPQLGVKTGADDVFVVPHPDRAPRPAARGRDLSPWRFTLRAHVLWTHAPDGRPLERLPPELARALGPHLDRLRRRSDYRAGAPWQLFRTALAHAPHRVLWPDLGRRLAAVVPEPEVVPLNTVYGIATRTADDAHALAALLNSRWLTALARLRADPARGGFHRFNARVVRELPVPADAAAWAALSVRGRARASADTAPAVARLRAILARYGGALLADAVGLGKSYVALAVALGTGEPFALVVPAVLVPQWRSLLARHDSRAPILTHESLSGRSIRLTAYPTIRLLVVDEAHRFRNPETNRYRALARLAAGGQRGQGGQGGGGGRKVLLVT